MTFSNSIEVELSVREGIRMSNVIFKIFSCRHFVDVSFVLSLIYILARVRAAVWQCGSVAALGHVLPSYTLTVYDQSIVGYT